MGFISLFGNNEEPEKPSAEDEQEGKKSFFGRMRDAVTDAVGIDRMKDAVARTRESLTTRMEGIVALTRTVDEAALEDLESVLLTSDLGVQTTSSGKLAAWSRAQGNTVLLCAADTFRAAAIEQLEVWSQRSGVEMIKTKQGGDP